MKTQCICTEPINIILNFTHIHVFKGNPKQNCRQWTGVSQSGLHNILYCCYSIPWMKFVMHVSVHWRPKQWLNVFRFFFKWLACMCWGSLVLNDSMASFGVIGLLYRWEWWMNAWTKSMIYVFLRILDGKNKIIIYCDKNNNNEIVENVPMQASSVWSINTNKAIFFLLQI